MSDTPKQQTALSPLEALIEHYEFLCRTSVPGGRKIRLFEDQRVTAAREEREELVKAIEFAHRTAHNWDNPRVFGQINAQGVFDIIELRLAALLEKHSKQGSV